MIDTTKLDVYEAACLAGGIDRAIDTAVVALLESGSIRAQRGGTLALVDPTPRHGVEGAVLDAIGPRASRSLTTVRLRAGQDERLACLAERLERDGLLSTGVVWRLGGRGRRQAPTLRGRRVLRQLRAEPPAWISGTSARRVALGGPGQLIDHDLRVAVFGTDAKPSRRFGRAHGYGIGAAAGTHSCGSGAGFACGSSGGHSCGGSGGGCGGGGGGCGGGGCGGG